MANPRKTTRIGPRDSVDPEGRATKVFPGEAVTDPRPITLFDNLRPDDQIRIYREDERTHKSVFHGVLGRDEGTEDRVFELFGGGKYRAQVMARNEGGSYIVDRSSDFILPGSYKPVVGDLPGTVRPPGIVGVIPASSVAPVSGTRELMESAMFSKVMELMQSGKAPSAIDWPPIVASMATLAGTIITGLLNKKSGPDPETRAALDRMENILAGIKGQPGPATTAIGDAVRAIKELVEVRDVIQGGANSDGGEKGQMWAMGAKLLEAIAARGAMPQAPDLAMPQLASPGPQAPGPVHPLWHQWLLHYEGQLVTAARRGADPQGLAEMVANMLPTDEEGILLEFLAKVNAESLVLEVVPALRDFPTWTAAVIRALREEMGPDDEHDPGEVADADD